MENFINVEYIEDVLKNAKQTSKEDIAKILEKAQKAEGLNHKEVAALLTIEDQEQIEQLHKIANELKKKIYGDRVVLFAPLYISNYCVNNCKYCGYQHSNEITRAKLSMEEIANEVKSLEKIGHKRLALELGEDPLNLDIDYVVDAIKTIYASGDIRRVNVNIAATDLEDYKKLNDAEIGTYILFQETYHPEVFKEQHPSSLKGNYERQLFAHHKAIEAGLDDVGGGVLFGLYDYQFEVVALMLHNEELLKNFGVEFHTMSVPRLKPANGMSLEDYPYIISDDDFVKIVSIIRVAAPHVGMILSTRESEEMRKRLLNQGISQISANSKTTVGGYSDESAQAQFSVEDERTLLETIKDLINNGDLPSYCTACYRMGRTGKEFHDQVSNYKISQMCHPNAILTSLEYAIETQDKELYDMTYPFLLEQIEKIQDPAIKAKVETYFERINNGERDLYI